MARIDISRPLTVDVRPWPGRPPLRLITEETRDAGLVVRNTEIRMDAHLGTHLDTGLHMTRAGREPVGHVDLDALIGPAVVVEVPTDPISASTLRAALGDAPSQRVLLKTQGVPEAGLDEDGARWLVDRGIRCVGIDQPSIQSRRASNETHVKLLEAGVAIIEGLELTGAKAGHYRLICLPLALLGSEGVPARAILEAES